MFGKLLWDYTVSHQRRQFLFHSYRCENLKSHMWAKVKDLSLLKTSPVPKYPQRIIYKNIVVEDNIGIFCFEFNAEVLSQGVFVTMWLSCFPSSHTRHIQAYRSFCLFGCFCHLANWVTNSMELRPLDVRPLGSFPAFHWTRRFNTEFTRALHLFLSWARPIQSTYTDFTLCFI
jgi:hypothetical protein